MNGPEHYREGERHLSAASFLDKPGGSAVDPARSAHHLLTAQAHFTAAHAAAAAAQLADRYVGDGEHISNWRKAIGATGHGSDEDPWAATQKPYISWKPYSKTVETALANLNLAGHVTPADTLAAAIPVIAGHVAEALVDGENDAVRAWARGVTDELRRVGLDISGLVERHVEGLNGGVAFSYDRPLGYSDEPPF